MLKYTLKRILLLIPTIIGISLFIFLAMEAASGDFVSTLITEEMTDEEVHALRASYGLDKPVLERYVDYMWTLLHGDLGTSYTSRMPVMELFMQKIGNTTMLAVASTIVCILISIPLGIFAARHRGSIFDNISNVLGVLGLSIPNFWLGLMLIVWFSVQRSWLPPGGNDDGILSVILPAITVGTGHTAILMRTTRSAMLDTLRQDYLRTARAKGVSERKVINVHALRNAMIPILSVALTQFAGCFGGAALTETVFGWPGVGKMVVDAVKQRDIPLACGTLIMKCIIISLIGLATDLLYVVVDPRVKTQFASAKRGKRNG